MTATPAAGGGQPQGLDLPNGPMTIGTLTTLSSRAVGLRPGLLLGLGALRELAMLVGWGAVFAALGGASYLSVDGGFDAQVFYDHPSALVLVLVILAVVPFVVIYKVEAMQTAAVDALARGQQPTWASVRAATRGVGRRLYGLHLLVVFAVLGGLVALLLVAGMMSEHGDDTGIGLFLLLMLLLMPVGLWLGVRWCLVAQTMTIEHPSMSGSLRRSAALVKGRWWSTFGRVLTGLVGPALLGSAVQRAIDRSFGSETGLSQMGLSFVAMCVVDVVTFTWSAAFLTLMYVDARRAEVHRPAGWVPGQSFAAFPPAPGQFPSAAPWPAGPRPPVGTPGQPGDASPQPPAWPQAPAAPQSPTTPQVPTASQQSVAAMPPAQGQPRYPSPADPAGMPEPLPPVVRDNGQHMAVQPPVESSWQPPAPEPRERRVGDPWDQGTPAERPEDRP